MGGGGWEGKKFSLPCSKKKIERKRPSFLQSQEKLAVRKEEQEHYSFRSSGKVNPLLPEGGRGGLGQGTVIMSRKRENNTQEKKRDIFSFHISQ